MLGYDISWAAFNIIEVMSSTKFTFKVKYRQAVHVGVVVGVVWEVRRRLKKRLVNIIVTCLQNGS